MIIATEHAGVDYERVAARARLIFDARNAMKGVKNRENIEVL